LPDKETQLGTKMTVLLTLQDAHEFLNFLLNELVDILEKEARAAKSNSGNQAPSEKVPNGGLNGMANGNHKEPIVTWVHKIFQVIFYFFLTLVLPCHLLNHAFSTRGLHCLFCREH
jgi:hypothetical protein